MDISNEDFRALVIARQVIDGVLKSVDACDIESAIAENKRLIGENANLRAERDELVKAYNQMAGTNAALIEQLCTAQKVINKLAGT